MKYVSLSLSLISMLMTVIGMYLVIKKNKAIGLIISYFAIIGAFIALGIALCI